ncbi:GntR family transcriptional regulator [Catellatospora methionotrophica]|uniref:GntR family transcriptional regulator n=1 Tax=Catellatospora methionotrophica TaxID=121620 RepID=UPI00140BB320|nr:GntR family transcriptional regulator [Catellatospora methionotrophica]
MIEFHLDRASGIASYLQIVQQVKHAIRLGVLQPGDQLPTAREVVDRLAINPNTVLKAYRDLERQGLAVGRPGLGTFVQGTLGVATVAAQDETRRELDRVVQAGRAAGLDREDVKALFAAVLNEVFREDST